MRLVFTKLITPLKKILVDLGKGFEEVPLEELQDSTTGRYLQLSDTVVPSLVRVKVNSSEKVTFDMIKEYQITDDEGNILGGNSGTSCGTITPYAKKLYSGRGYSSALVFDHTQITGECSYTDVYGSVYTINLQENSTNLHLVNEDIASFELDLNGSKVIVNVLE